MHNTTFGHLHICKVRRLYFCYRASKSKRAGCNCCTCKVEAGAVLLGHVVQLRLPILAAALELPGVLRVRGAVHRLHVLLILLQCRHALELV